MPLRAFNPVSSFRWARGMTIVAALMTVFFIMQLVGQVPAALWVIFGEDRFRWSATMIGLSLAVFGNLARPRSSLRHWSRHQTFRREAGHYRRHGGPTGAHDRAPVVEDPARLAGLPYWLAE